MQLPNPTSKSDLLEIINRVLILIGLPIVSFDYGDISTKSDAGMVNYLLQNQTREILARGWWFNTKERVVIPAGTSQFRVIGSSPLSVQPSPISNFECQGDYFKLSDNSSVILDGSEEEDIVSKYDSLVDLIVALPLTSCPTLFVDYVVYKTARIYGKSIGMKMDLIDEQQAASRLEVENDRSSPQHNWFKESTIARN